MNKYTENQRFSSIKESTHVNQHKKDDLLNTRYRWLIRNTTVKSSELGFFLCWIVNESSGIDETKGGYPRMSFSGKKIFTHQFVWEYHKGKKPDEMDISHLCQNKRCCRPSHLHVESRSMNKSRDHCIGIVSPAIDKQNCYRLCQHEPICCTDGLLILYTIPKEQ